MNRYFLLLFFGPLSVAVAARSFQNPRAINIDGSSVTASVTDMNNDGIPDLIAQTGSVVTRPMLLSFRD